LKSQGTDWISGLVCELLLSVWSVLDKRRTAVTNEDQDKVSSGFSRRNIFGIGSALATAALSGVAANAQQRDNTRTAERNRSASNPGPENRPLLK
jgi:hypothetical protein